MTKRRSRRPLRLFWSSFGHWGLVIDWSLVIGHWSLGVKGSHWSLIQRQCPALSPGGSSLPISFPLDTVGVKAAIVAAQRLVRTQPRAEQGAVLYAFGPRTC